MLNYWDVIDSRLYNLRHNLSITGQPISIPLYATPVNPALLVQMNASGGSLKPELCAEHDHPAVSLQRHAAAYP